MKQKTSMFGTAMSSCLRSINDDSKTEIVTKKVGRPKGYSKKISNKSSFTTKLDNDFLSMIKSLSEEKSLPINRIIEDLVRFALFSIGRTEFCYNDVKFKSEKEKKIRHDMRVVADRYKKVFED